MCGRYLIDDKDYEFREIITEAVRNSGDTNIKSGEIFPTDKVPVLLQDGSYTKPYVMGWGFPNIYKSGVIINARAESALEKRMFKDSLLSRRCVIPASGFFEWEKKGSAKNKYLFTLPGSNMIYLAGFYNGYIIGGMPVNRFVILTTAANRSISDIHDRMPLILLKNEVRDWITNRDFALSFLSSIPPDLDRSLV